MLEVLMATDHAKCENKDIAFHQILRHLLKSVDSVKMLAFLRNWEREEIEVREKIKEIPLLTVASYKISVDPGPLTRMHYLK